MSESDCDTSHGALISSELPSARLLSASTLATDVEALAGIYCRPGSNYGASSVVVVCNSPDRKKGKPDLGWLGLVACLSGNS